MTAPNTTIRSRSAPKRWVDPPLGKEPAEQVHEHPLLQRLLVQRGIRSAAEAAGFLDHRPVALPDPFRLADMDRAAERITQAIESGERIAIFGDYDVDGITSAAIIQLALKRVADDPALVVAKLPTRADGYGLNDVTLDTLANIGTTLLIAVDCGSTDTRGVAHARSLGMDVVIIDHHHMSNLGPDGAITISPARPDCGVYREMSAAGLSLLLVAALEQSSALSKRGIAGMSEELIDLAALGTVADVSSMMGANRQLVREGLRALRRGPRIGLQALCQSSSIDWRTLNTISIGYAIAPRLNAAGRMRDPQLAMDLLLTSDPKQAQRIAGELEKLNVERRAETDSVVNAVLGRLDASGALEHALVIVESAPGWRTGILGLAAGQLVERLGHPVILLAEEDGLANGSCRSVPGFNVIQALHRHNELIEQFGGHSQAAGLSLVRSNIGALQQALNEEALLSGVALPVDPRLRLDADIRQEDLTLEMARMIMRLSPFGIDNPEPVFRLSGVRILRTETMGRDGSHLRLVWRGPAGEVRAPFFSAAYRASELSPAKLHDIACTLSVSHWNGPRLDIKVLDFRESAP